MTHAVRASETPRGGVIATCAPGWNTSPSWRSAGWMSSTAPARISRTTSWVTTGRGHER